MSYSKKPVKILEKIRQNKYCLDELESHEMKELESQVLELEKNWNIFDLNIRTNQLYNKYELPWKTWEISIEFEDKKPQISHFAALFYHQFEFVDFFVYEAKKNLCIVFECSERIWYENYEKEAWSFFGKSGRVSFVWRFEKLKLYMKGEKNKIQYDDIYDEIVIQEIKKIPESELEEVAEFWERNSSGNNEEELRKFTSNAMNRLAVTKPTKKQSENIKQGESSFVQSGKDMKKKTKTFRKKSISIKSSDSDNESAQKKSKIDSEKSDSEEADEELEENDLSEIQEDNESSSLARLNPSFERNEDETSKKVKLEESQELEDLKKLKEYQRKIFYEKNFQFNQRSIWKRGSFYAANIRLIESQCNMPDRELAEKYQDLLKRMNEDNEKREAELRKISEKTAKKNEQENQNEEEKILLENEGEEENQEEQQENQIIEEKKTEDIISQDKSKTKEKRIELKKSDKSESERKSESKSHEKNKSKEKKEKKSEEKIHENKNKKEKIPAWSTKNKKIMEMEEKKEEKKEKNEEKKDKSKSKEKEKSSEQKKSSEPKQEKNKKDQELKNDVEKVQKNSLEKSKKKMKNLQNLIV